MKKAEKRLYIREVAKEVFANGYDIKAEDALSCSVYFVELIESFERKQDEEEAKKKACFNDFDWDEQRMRMRHCGDCAVSSACQEKRGAK